MNKEDLFSAIGALDASLLPEPLESHTARPKTFHLARKLLAAAALLALLSFGVYSAAIHWKLPKPETYEPENGGIYDVHTQSSYESIPADTNEPDSEELTDAELIQKAESLLHTLGLKTADTGSMTVTRRENLLYGREEAEIAYPDSDIHTTVCLHAKTGQLLSLSSIDYMGDATPVRDDEQALALATTYYQMLPVKQGYAFTNVTKYDDQYWSYEFCRMVTDSLANPYEMVRIAVNPVTGRMTGCNVFYFPLLDDHEPQDIPLTKEAAIAFAEAVDKVNLEQHTLVSAEVEIVLPNWFFTEYMSDVGNARYSEVSRYAWHLVYENTDSEIADIIKLDIDLYTGELLGGDMT